MGNNHSASNRSARPGSPPVPPSSSSAASGRDSPRHHRKDGSRNMIPIHSTQRTAAPPEASLAQAQGSTAASVGKPKSLPATTISLSGSPHSSVSTPGKSSESRPAPVFRDEPSKPVDVPLEGSSFRSHNSANQPFLTNVPQLESHLMANNSLTDMYITRPPRLPLPIEEEVHTPGSPILGPDETLADIELGESSDGLTRKSSALSTNTVEEEEGEELRVDKTRPVVATRLEWRGGGEKVYVTGTIFQWNRKQRLHPVEGRPGVFAGTIHILPGTHHVRFLVDGIMQTSPELPTTVDFGNNLVNYIEVSPDDVPEGKRTASGTITVGDQGDGRASRTPSQLQDQAKAPRGKPVLPPGSYCIQIPQYLLDFDQAEDSPAYRNALAAIEKLPTPPSLPGFLAKPILNAATLMKDDNSVLNMPNHTVLNHLATSSIKHNVLAVSATTRYHSKYVTTIIYKPTSTEEG